MTDYISRQAAKDAFMKATADGDKVEFCWWVLDKLPIIDAVPVVRCKDCKRHNAKAGKLYRCDLLNVWHDGDFFCANGERREDGEIH